jgi:formate/nitrite transporter
MAAVDRLISPGQLARSWAIVYVGNFAGAVALVLVVWLSGILDGPMGDKAAAIAEGKAALGWTEAFMRGVLCNMLVCLAVWLTIAARTASGKILSIIWPIASFVMLGLEHSIANMYLIPQGMLAGADMGLGDFANNLIPVTLGNILGGAGGVAITYRLAYGPKATR